MAGIERWLKQSFERRVIKELKGSFQGPKKLKASGKAAGSKKKKPATGTAKGKPAARKPARRTVANPGGLAPPKRKR